MSEKRILTIERAKWRRGGPGAEVNGVHITDEIFGRTLLLNEKGMMCCLGFDALACGLDPADIEGLGEPSEIARGSVFDMVYDDESDEWIGEPNAHTEYYNTRIRDDKSVLDAIDVNDSSDLTDAEREAKIAEVLCRLGWDEVVFV